MTEPIQNQIITEASKIARFGLNPIKKAVNATMYIEFANITTILVGRLAHSSNLQAIVTMNMRDIQEVARKYTTTFARINCGTRSGSPFMKSGESNIVSQE